MVKFVVFYRGKDNLKTYLPLMQVGKAALNVTNPGADYVVLTDEETAPYLDKNFEVEVLAPAGPLMLSYVYAQMFFCQKQTGGLTVLAGSDCVANRDLSDSLQRKHGMAITYRTRGLSKINNVAYIKDHELAAWFLNRALGYMKPDELEWLGDQASWERALGPYEDWVKLDPNGEDEGPRVATVEDRKIYLYRCKTHNYFNKSTSGWPKTVKDAYLVHFKGPDPKKYMVKAVTRSILRRQR